MEALKNENESKDLEMSKHSNSDKPDLKGDWLNFFLLLLLYTMQGIPLGLMSSIPILLQSNKNVSYNDQAIFSLAIWPFSLKILWAPLVDALYVQKFGRRKSWLIPVQILMGVSFMYMAINIDDWLSMTGKPNVLNLTYVFLIIIVLAATQDIVVDGWGLTILKRNNVGYTSTCQWTGQMVGNAISTVLPVLLTSEEFCNKYLRLTPTAGGVVTMRSLFYVWGILFLIITTLVALFKKEKDNRLEDDHVKLSIFQNYALLWDIMKLSNVRILAIALLTVQIGFAAIDNVSTLKLIDAGVSKENITIIETAMISVKVILPLTVAKYTSGLRPLSIYINAMPISLLWNLTFVILIYYTPTLINHNSIVDIPIYYYVMLIVILIISDSIGNLMFLTLTAFFSRISDSRFGGTYMTLFATLSNLGGSWTSSVAIGMIDLLTYKKCSTDSQNNCSTPDLQTTCKTNGGDCVVLTNGYYIEVVVSTLIGILWYFIFKNIFKSIQTQDYSNWLVDVKKPIGKKNQNLHTVTDAL